MNDLEHEAPVDADVQVAYLWESNDTTSWAAIPSGYTSKDLLLPAPIQAEAGTTYQVISLYS